MNELHKSNYIKTLSKMKVIITTKGGLRLEGTNPETKSYIVGLDVPLQDIDSETLKKLYDEEICAAELSKCWHVIVARNIIESIEFVD